MARTHVLTTLGGIAATLALLAAGGVLARHGVFGDDADSWQRTELFFGCAIPGGGEVGPDQWQHFVRDEVTGRFPAGATTLTAAGQWRDPKGEIVREDSRVIVLLHRGSAAEDDGIEAIRREYVSRFRQDAVMRVDAAARVRF